MSRPFGKSRNHENHSPAVPAADAGATTIFKAEWTRPFASLSMTWAEGSSTTFSPQWVARVPALIYMLFSHAERRALRTPGTSLSVVPSRARSRLRSLVAETKEER